MSEEEIKFLREHIKGICAYKGLQEELTYDVSLDILRKICLALDFLQQENSQLKEEKEKTKYAIVENCDLRKEILQLKERVEKAIEYIKGFDFEHLHEVCEHNLVETLEVLLEILKGDKE